jgi:K+-sensing histidine kinase KdpD
VDILDRFNRHYRLLATGFVAPLVVCLIVLPFRNSVPNTSAALLLVLVVVGVASAGDRPAGLLAALSAGLGFDFFLTPPYESLAIFSAADVQTTLLLLGVGVAVTEIACRGREQQAMASKRLGYLDGVEATAKIASEGSSSPSALIERVAGQIVQ